MLKNKVRIIGGQWRRLQLEFPDAEGLRPTPDRVRETLFNWLGQDLDGQSCLDLFAGAGGLGFEAASRGARRVVMIDMARPVLQALEANRKRLGGNAISVVAADARAFVSRNTERFDLIFVDPPFASTLAAELLPHLSAHLTEGGRLYLECAEVPDLTGWQIHRQGRAGKVQYLLLQKG